MSALLVAALVCASSSSAQWLGPPVKGPVSRVVTLAPSLTETVVELGALSSLVGVSRFEELAAVKDIPIAGGFNDVDIEAIIRLKPEVLLVQKSPGNQAAVEQLSRLKVSVLALSLTTVADCLTAITELGALLNKREEAKRLTGAIEEARAQVRSHAAARRVKPTVLLAYGFNPLIVAGPGSFAHELLEDCGVVNLAKKAPSAYPTFSMEELIAAPPDVIIDGADDATGKDALQKLKRLKHTTWLTLPSKDLLHPGPALARGLLQLEALLFPTR